MTSETIPHQDAISSPVRRTRVARRREPPRDDDATIPRTRFPTATYRLQFNRGFTFRDAEMLVDYLHDLGISDIYASPILLARAGSVHGYDVLDHGHVNPELGTEADLERLAAALHARDMGLILDIVPNHMCIAPPGDNRWWRDILENGPSSPFAGHFDIDWSPPKRDLANQVLLPILGDQYGRVLDQKQLQVVFAEGAFHLQLDGTQLPLATRSWFTVLKPALDELRVERGVGAPEVVELESIVTAMRYLPRRTESDAERIRERLREKEVIKRRLLELTRNHPPVLAAIDRDLRRLNGTRSDPRSFDRLEAMLAGQAYRLCHWRVASDEINYRRFFDVNDLAVIRVDEPQVFAAVHELPLRFIASGWVDGLRIDHVDGLLDPAGYLRALATAVQRRSRSEGDGASAAPPARPGVFIVVEKILMGHESVRSDWPVHGTTGYDFLNLLNGVFVRPPAARVFRRTYGRFVDGTPAFREHAYAGKKLVLATAMSSELTMLARRLDRISEQHRWSRDFTLNSLQSALAEVIACFPVYRTYTRPDQDIDAADRASLQAAVRLARRRNPATSGSVFDFIASVLLHEDPAGLSEAAVWERRQFVARFQQMTGPITAKGVEDTALYRYCPLVSLNEVGGGPDRFGVGMAEFHRALRERMRLSPHALSATATHDTKRGEDVRTRLDALSEIPNEWFRAVGRWHVLNLPRKERVEDAVVPDRDEEYFLYQTLIGAWPTEPMDAAAREAFVARMEAYLVKALREAKVHTSWIDPHEAYEQAAVRFLRAILAPGEDNAFLPRFEQFIVPLARAGMLSSLSQVVIKACAPGVPDFYQGCDLWDLRLVDPDNRAPVDFAHRRQLLASLRDADPEALLRSMADGRIKLLVTQRALMLRRTRRELFARGDHVPLAVSGGRREHVCAFARSLGTESVVVVASRFHMLLGARDALPVGEPTWGRTTLALPRGTEAGTYRDVLTGLEIGAEREGGTWTMPLARVLARLPVALLEGAASARREAVSPP